MSGFCGWIADREIGPEQFARMRAGLGAGAARDGDTISSRGCGLLNVEFDGWPKMVRQGNLVAVVDGSPRFDESELAELASREGPAAALIEGYRRRGTDVLDVVHGGFSLAVIHIDERRAFLAIDRVGGRYPIYYTAAAGALLFGTSADALRGHPLGARELDPQGIYDYLFFHVVPAPRTAWKGVARLLPGNLLLFGDGEASTRRYWAPRYVENERRPLAELEDEFVELLKRSVRHGIENRKAGCFLSGGTDSSTIAGILCGETESPPPSFSIGFDSERYDEMKYARLAAGHFGTEHHEYYLKPEDVVDLIPRVAQTYSEPFGNESVVPAYHCARMARERGLDRLLGGDGGDELFAGNSRYVKQRVFERYRMIPSSIRGGLLEPVLFGLPGGQSLWPVRKARNYVRQANVPMPDRTHAYAYLERIGAAQMLQPEFFEQIDPDEPKRLTREVYDGAQAGTMLNRFLAMDLKFTLADNDLPKVGRMCALEGITVDYPFLHDDMIEFASRLPVGIKLKGSRLRWFFKHALRDFLPPEILTKSKHGMGMPFGLWLTEHRPLQDLVHDSLEGIKQRGIVRPEFVDSVIEMHQREHAVYYGVMIWMLVQLEQWFRAHVPDPVSTGGTV